MASWAIPGMGMFCEAYYIFSVGNVKPLWAAQWPKCFNVSSDSPLYLSCTFTNLVVMGHFEIKLLPASLWNPPELAGNLLLFSCDGNCC